MALLRITLVHQAAVQIEGSDAEIERIFGAITPQGNKLQTVTAKDSQGAVWQHKFHESDVLLIEREASEAEREHSINTVHDWLEGKKR